MRLAFYIGIAVGLGVAYHDLGHTYASIRVRDRLEIYMESFKIMERDFVTP